MTDLRQLRMFLTVAEELHFGRAAARLRTAQPALSQAIKRLERDIGVPLFVRTTRNVSLTGAGKVFFERVSEVLADLASAEEEVRQVHAGGYGTLHVGFTTLAPHRLLPRLASLYRERYPDVRFRPETVPSRQQRDRIYRRELDAGLLWRPSGDVAPTTSQVSYRALVKQRLVAAVPTGHLLARSPCVHLADLAQEPLVTYLQVPGGSEIRSTLWTACGSAGFEPRVVQEAPDAYSILWVVSAGVGISLLPECCADMLVPGVDIVPLDVEEHLYFSLAWHRDNNDKLLHGFVETVVDIETEFPDDGR